MVAEAIDHALAVEDYPHAVELIEKVALPMILQASLRTVEGWLQTIPLAYIEKSPRIHMAVAWMNLLRGAIPKAVPSIERLKIIFATPEAVFSPSLQGE
jgi:ATP/maltotriose-dependent transcriptional regulator MalT